MGAPAGGDLEPGRRTAFGLVIAFFLAPMAGIGAASVAWNDSYTALALTVGVMCGALVGIEWRRSGQPLTPTGIVGLGGLVIFSLRPLSIQATRMTSAGAMADTRVFAGPAVEAGRLALLQVVLFLLAYGLTYLVRVSDDRAALARAETRPPRPHRAAVVLIFAIIVAVACAAILIHSSGGLSAHMSGISQRSAFLAGRYFLTLGYVPLSIALVLYVLARRNAGLRGWSALALIAVFLLLSVAFVTGGRGPVILSAAIPLMLLKQVGPRPWRTPTLVLAGTAVVAGGMVMSILLRENVYTHGAAARQLETSPVQTLISRLTSGQETRPFDSLIVLNMANQTHDMRRQYGATYLDVPKWFLPGSIAGDKGGANSWFTKKYLPRFYYPYHVETSISAVGEAFANFGWFGIPLAGGLLGSVAARFTSLRRASVGSTAVYILLTPIFFSFVRGDAYQNISLALLLLVGTWIACRWARSPRSLDESRGDARRRQTALRES